MRSIRLLLALSLLSLPLGCAASKAYREGTTLADAGQSYQAAIRYLDSLDHSPGYAMARDGLAGVKREAYGEKLAEARLAEARKDWGAALAAYGEIGALLSRIAEHGAIGFSTIDVAERIAATENKGADDHYTLGEQAHTAGDWAGAIAAWKAAQALVPTYRDTATRIGAAYFAWGADDETKGRWREATGHYIEAGASGHTAGPARAAAIFVALGNAFVWSGNCRQALRDLRAARDLVGAALVKDDLETAESCAINTVVVLPFENPTRNAPGGMALDEVAADGLAIRLRTAATPFVTLLERGAVDHIRDEQRFSEARTGVAGGLARAHWLVIGKLTQVKVVPGAISREPATAVGRTASTCPEARADGTSAIVPCVKDVPIRYVEHTGHAEVRLAGSVRVINSRSGAQAALVPFNVRQAADVHYADGFLGPDGRKVSLTTAPIPAGATLSDVQVPAALLALQSASRDFPDEGDLLHAALDIVYTEVTPSVLGIIDADPPVTDPARLVVTAL